MAKKKTADDEDFRDDPEDGADTGPGAAGGDEKNQSAEHTSELDALRARLAELEAENTALKSSPPAAIAAAGPPGVPSRWKVSLNHVPARVVEATDAANAIETFKREAGVIHSEHQFEVGPAPGEPLTRDVLGAA